MAVLQATSITGGLTMHGMAAGFMKVSSEGAVMMDTNTYATTSQLSSYLALTGGTLSGNLTMSGAGSSTSIIFGDSTKRINVEGYWMMFKGHENEGFRWQTAGQDGVTYTTRMQLTTSALTMNGNIVLHAGNYNSYSPTLTGGGASGTWGINITGSAGSASSASSVPWTGVSSGTRNNYTLAFQPPSNGYAGFEFLSSTGGGGGYFLIRGTSDSDVYTAEGITLVADGGWLTLAQRTQSNKGVRIMTGSTSTTRLQIDSSGNTDVGLGAGTVTLYYGGSARFWTGSDGTRTQGWSYFQNTGQGLHWPGNNWHLHPASASDFIIRSGSNTDSALRFDTNGTTRGYVYAENDNTIGFLTNSRNWAFRTYSNGNALVYGYLTVNGAGTSSSIYMNDTDNGQREIHCNSNRIGFLNQSGNWGAWNDDNGNWGMSLNAYMAGNRFDIQGAEGQISFKDGDNVWTGYVGFTGNLGYLSFPGRNVKINSGYNNTITLETGVSGYNSGVVSIPYGRLTVDNSYIYAGTYVEAGSDMRAPIFYDSNNTAYYGNFASTSRMAYVTMDQSTGAHNHMTYGGSFSGGDWQTLTNTEGQLNVVQVNNINGGGYSNQPPNVYTYGGVLSWRTVNHSFQLYASHTGDITFKTQWNNDNYSGWRRILHESNYNTWAPTLTGGGASGTWSINITGGAGSANLASQVTINYNNDSNSTYQLLWGSGNSVYGTSQVYVNPSSDIIYARGGYISPGNPWGTADSAFFPNGITTAAGTNWVYGHTYLGNAPSNGSGAEVSSVGRIYVRNGNTSGTWGYAGLFIDRNNAANNYVPFSFENEYGNHSWGLVARFHVQGSSSDRPSIQFSSGYSNTRWSVGYCYPDDNFRITQNHGQRPDNSTNDGWGTERFRINTDGNTLIFASLGIGGITPDTRLSVSGDAHVSNILYLGGSAGTVNSWGTRTYGNSGDWTTNARTIRFDNVGYGTSWSLTIDTSGNVESSASMRAPIFYDSNDTSYYVDPNGTSSLNTLTTGTRARWGQPIRWTNRQTYTSDQGYWTGTNGWGTSEGNWANAWKGGFSGWDIWGTSTDHPQGSGYIHAQGIVSGQHAANSDGSSAYGWMMVGAADATSNRYWLRGKWGGSTSGWVEMITSGNIGSQSVSYASSAGNADTVDGYHATFSGNANTIPVRNGSGYLEPNNWIQLNGIYGLYSPTNNAHLRPNDATYGSWKMTGSRNGWQGIEFDSGSNGNVVLMINNDSNTSGFHNNSYGWQIRWYNGTLYIGKNSYGGNEATVLDSSNSPYAWNMNQYVRTTDNPTFNILTLSSYLTVGNGLNSSDIYMYDGDEGTRRIHCNSNRIGFLNQSASWGSYCDDTGNWVTDHAMYASNWFRAYGDTGLYSQDYGSHIRRTVSSSYGTWEIFGYSKGGYNGLNIQDPQGYVNNYMHESGNGGLYLENQSGRWAWYWHRGNVCLGLGNSTTSSSYRVYVSGGIYATDDIVAYSDRRKKTDIVTIDNALDKVTNLRGVFYTKIGEEDKGRKTGVIAQEINEVLPEVVTYAADVDEYGVSYGNIAGVLIEAIKEQNELIKTLKSEIDKLKAKLN